MLNASRLRDHGAAKSRLLARPAGLHVGPVEGARKHAEPRGDECDQKGLHRHRSNSVRLIDAIMLDLGLRALISIKCDRTGGRTRRAADLTFAERLSSYEEA